MDLVENITSKLSEPDTQETVGKFISLLNTFRKGHGDIVVTDEGSFTFRVVDGAPQLTVSRPFMKNLGTNALVLSLDAPATNDVVAKLNQVDNTVIRFKFDGELYHPEISHVVISKQPLYIQQFMKRQSLNNEEFEILKNHLLTQKMEFNVDDDYVSPVEEEIPEDIRHLLKDKDDVTVDRREEQPRKRVVVPDSPPPQRRVNIQVPSDDEESENEHNMMEIGVTEDLDELPRRKQVTEDSDDELPRRKQVTEDSDDELPRRKRPTTIHVSDDEEEEKKDDAEQSSRSVSIVYFRKKRDGTRDRSIGRVGNFVFRVGKKLHKGKQRAELICIGKYDAKNKDTLDLTKEDIAEAKRRNFTLATKYQ